MLRGKELSVALSMMMTLAVGMGCGDEVVDPTDRTPGSLEITTSTTGADIDPDGYILGVGMVLGEPEPERSIGVNATTTYSGLQPSAYGVFLKGVATNCEAILAQTVKVPAGDTARATFEVTCSAISTDGSE